MAGRGNLCVVSVVSQWSKGSVHRECGKIVVLRLVRYNQPAALRLVKRPGFEHVFRWW